MLAIVPARGGSKGFPGKNKADLAGAPLLAHSIAFAKKLPFVSDVIVSTDNLEYASIATQYGAKIPFLRSDLASADSSMEEDILEDIRIKCLEKNFPVPSDVLWLRPTHPLRSVESYLEAYKVYKSGLYDSVCVVTEDDPRQFNGRDGRLLPVLPQFSVRSMVRRQDCNPAYRIFGGEFFGFPTEYNKKFLGDNIGFVVTEKGCKFDIDHAEDLDYLNYLLAHDIAKHRYKHLIHINE